jgi:YHS domain-containing protein
VQDFAVSKNKMIDPVCGMAVVPIRSSPAVTHEGCTYYFCAKGCRQAFEANPKKYLAKKHTQRKGWWGRYLSRLKKSTGGKSMTCH